MVLDFSMQQYRSSSSGEVTKINELFGFFTKP